MKHTNKLIIENHSAADGVELFKSATNIIPGTLELYRF